MSIQVHLIDWVDCIEQGEYTDYYFKFVDEDRVYGITPRVYNDFVAAGAPLRREKKEEE